MLVEIHILQNHAPSNLNRDDTGSPKECTFGGVKRARISSQCLKRSIRRSEIFRTAMAGHLATRTRQLPELVQSRLLAEGLPAELAAVAAKKASGFGTSEGKEQEALRTAQTMFLTEADIAAVVAVLGAAAREAGGAKALEKVPAKDLQAQAQQAGFRPISVDIGLFGRMTTSEAFRDVEAAAQVAHALSTHKVDHEFDYFTAVDDLKEDAVGDAEEDAGADMLGDVEFNSACYYKYFSVDVAGLVANLTGASMGRTVPAEEQAAAETLAAEAVAALLRAAVLTTPSGKQHSFAAHQLPAAVLVELRPVATPVSYANAFVQPARQRGETSLVQDSLLKFKAHVEALTAGFNLPAAGRFLLAPESAVEIGGVETVGDLHTLCARLTAALASGEKVGSHG
ncbi:MAG TPA: type I-E CRISPR-associated protein Cas7/Cse4/CasC [Armatimonadota bacterium]|nr:type I-E CRISPR-associated protein Cas7/Cse4/CasC [Armatimonadota bacterium]